jgi:hypothetical protein
MPIAGQWELTRRRGESAAETRLPLSVISGKDHFGIAGPDRPGHEGVSVKEISIGEFARRSRLSLRALRLYQCRLAMGPRVWRRGGAK